MAAALEPLYLKIAHNLTGQMTRGTLRPGDRVPSLRRLCRQQRVSLSTATQAYLWLENRGYLEARPQSGFYVRAPFAERIPEPSCETARPGRPLVGGSVLAEVMEASATPGLLTFGAASASPELLPTRRLNQIMRQAIRRQPEQIARYEFPPGFEPLRRQIARRSADMGCTLSPRDVLITSGAMEAIHLSLRAVARPGDTIAVESPTYFCILESLASLGMKAVEISTHPQEGMDLDELERALRKHHVKAVLTISNCHNPLGFVTKERHKRALVELTAQRGIAVIEDDIYGDLAFAGPRPHTAKAFDQKGLVLLCSSYSKILAPGLRLGWVAAGRFQGEVERLKFLTSISTAWLPQVTVAEFLESGGYDRHLRRLRTSLACQVEMVRQAIAKYFPEGTRISRPAGGYLLWVELPSKVDALKLFRAALAERISILPGHLFSASGRFRNAIRINCGQAWSDQHDRGLLTLGRLCEKAQR
jgi:DNA-binding transcriptional MocR family regulator